VIFSLDVHQFSSARRALSTALPDDIVGRQQQLTEMEQFLKLNFAQPKSQSKSQLVEVKKSLYVSGPPGTGKTTCLKHLIKTMPEISNGQVLKIQTKMFLFVQHSNVLFFTHEGYLLVCQLHGSGNIVKSF